MIIACAQKTDSLFEQKYFIKTFGQPCPDVTYQISAKTLRCRKKVLEHSARLILLSFAEGEIISSKIQF